MQKRVIIIGWDCAAPELVFDAFKDDMPNTHPLDGRRHIRKTGEYNPTYHRPRLDVYDDQPRSRRTRHLRLSQP